MRRKDREITDELLIDELINKCDCCRIALNDDKGPYIVPLNFGYSRTSEGPVFYFHGAGEGRKIDLIKRNGYAGFELDNGHELLTHEQACGHSFLYQSVIGHGSVTIIPSSEKEKKKTALNLIMKQYTGKDNWNFPSVMLDRVAVIELKIAEMSCKQHKKR